MKNEGLTQSQAAGKCEGMWKEAQNQQKNLAASNTLNKPVFVIRCCKYTEGMGFNPDDAKYLCNGIWDEIKEEYPGPPLPGGEDGPPGFQPPDPDQDGEPDWRKIKGGNTTPGGGQYQVDEPMTPQDVEDKVSWMIRCTRHKQNQGQTYDEAKYDCNKIWEKERDEPRGGGQEPEKPQDGTSGEAGRNAAKTDRILMSLNCADVQPLTKKPTNLDKKQEMNTSENDFKAVCVYGDRFYKGKFLPMKELEKSYKSLNGSYHDINHWGTTYMDGNPNVEYIVGWNDNVRLDPATKAMTADIHIVKTAKNYSTWRGFADINKGANKTPNVSVSFYSSKKKVKASELKGIDFAAEGYHGDDDVEYLYDLDFQALSTVFKGACSDKDGCGIQKQDATVCKDKECDNIRIKNLEEKIKRFKGKE